MGYFFQNSGFVEFPELMKTVVKDMVSGGFELIHSNVNPEDTELLKDTVEIELNDTVLTKDIDYETAEDLNPDGTFTIEMSTAPFASDRLTANFDYIGQPIEKTDIESVDVTKSLNTEFKSVKSISTSSYLFNDTETTGLRIEVSGGGVYNIESTDYTIDTTTNPGYLGIDITNKELIPETQNFNVFVDTRINTTLSRFFYYIGAFNDGSAGNVTFDDINNIITYTFPLHGSGLKTIDGGDYTNFTNIDGNEVVTSLQHGVSGEWASLTSFVTTVVTSVDFQELTVTVDLSTETALFDDIQANGTYATVNANHELYYDYDNLELDGDKGYTKYFRSPEFISPSGGLGFLDFSYSPQVYLDSTLLTQGTEYNFSEQNNRLVVEFFTDYIPETGSIVTFDYAFKPVENAKDVPLIGAKNETNTTFEISTAFNGTFYILEAGSEVDPLNSEQPWRIAIDTEYEENLPLHKISVDWTSGTVSRSLDSTIEDKYELVQLQVDGVGHYNLNLQNVKNYGKIYVGTPTQLQDDGTIAFMPMSKTQIDPYGRIYDEYTTGLLWTGVLNYSDTTIEYDAPTDDNFVLAKSYAITNSLDINKTRPMSYDLAISDHGVTLTMRSDGRADGKGNYFFAIQRLADAKDGSILTEGHSPVVALYHQEYIDAENVSEKLKDGSINIIEGVSYDLTRKYDINMVIVREDDVHTPTKPVPIYENSPYINGIWNKQKQLSINDREEYLIVIPDGLNTYRHLYSNKRMDMIAFCSANIIMEGGIAKVYVHGEPEQREYKAQRASIGYVEGWRLLQLIKNGGV